MSLAELHPEKAATDPKNVIAKLGLITNSTVIHCMRYMPMRLPKRS